MLSTFLSSCFACKRFNILSPAAKANLKEYGSSIWLYISCTQSGRELVGFGVCSTDTIMSLSDISGAALMSLVYRSASLCFNWAISHQMSTTSSLSNSSKLLSNLITSMSSSPSGPSLSMVF